MGDGLMDERNPEQRRYMRLAGLLEEEIKTGLRAPGAPMPSISILTQEHGISRQTVGKAMKVLACEGLIYREPGLGWFVAVPRR
jgi:GntR family transcriptional regulator